MTFEEILDQAIAMLQRRERLTYGALKRQFNLDDTYLEDLKAELIEGQRVAVDEDGRVLVWIGATDVAPTTTPRAPQPALPAPPRITPAIHPPQAATPPATLLPVDAERRQLTVLFCDLVDSSRLASQLDPEDYREVVRAYQATCMVVIRRYDGHIAQLLGDGLLVYFGYPHAHEDDVQRAVRAGLDMLEAMDTLQTRLEREHGIHLAVRIGIHTGVVVVGEMGDGGHHAQLAMGSTPNVASRLQSLAAPNTVVVSDATWHLVQGYFAGYDLGLQTFKGMAAPVPVYRVLGTSGAQSRLEVVSPRGLTTLVGRKKEVRLLLEPWRQLKDGHGQVVLLSGEAGIGKSRLVQVVKERVASERHTRWEWRGSPYHHQSPLYPVIAHLHRLLEWHQEEAPHERLYKLEKALEPFSFSLPEVVPLFASLLTLPLPDHYPPLTLTPQQQKQKTLEALLGWLRQETERQPVLYIVEDLHWLDPSTLEFLSLVVDQVTSMRLLMLLTFRPTFSPPWHLHTHLTQLVLSRLPRRQAARMIEAIAGGKALPAEVYQQLLAKTDGVPLFVEELTKMVLESGLLREANGWYELTRPLPALAIPATLHDSLMARLDRLATAKPVAQLGATIGRQFAYELLRAVAPMDEAALQEALGQLVEAELLYRRGLPPRATYLFKHALIQEAAYQSLLKSTRQQYHQRIAQMLAERFPNVATTQPELLAHHCTEAGLLAHAVPYWLQAGQQATERSANVEAISHLTKGLALLESLPAMPGRAEQELALQVALGAPLSILRGNAALEVEHAYARALTLCQQVGDDQQHWSALVGLWRCYLARASFQKAHETGERCLVLAQRVQDPMLLQEAHLMLGSILLYIGKLPSARVHLEQGIMHYEPQRRRSLTFSRATDLGVVSLSRLAWTLWLLGYPDRALTRIDEALTLAQASHHAYSIGFALYFAAIVHLCRREVRVTQERSEAVLALSSDHELITWSSGGQFMRGWVLAQQELIEEGLVQMHQSLGTWKTLGLEVGLSFLLISLAEVHWRAGRVDEGLHVLDEALSVVHSNDEHYYEAELYRLKGELLLLQTAIAEQQAESSFQYAMTIAHHLCEKSLELRAAISLSRLWQKQGRRAEAHHLLEGIYGWFTEGFDTADVQEAKALLEAL
jgi:class 3 adenylate cyclase/predicted ATPase